MIAAKWFDMVVGVDIHWVLVPAPPAPPIPTPLPHPFVGIIYDPIGLAVAQAIGLAVAGATGGPVEGPVLINNSFASATGTEGTNKLVAPHLPTPPGIAWAGVPAGLRPPIPGKKLDPGVPAPVPSNDATIVTGSKTVYINGTNATRLGDLAMSCGEPVRLPSSTVIAVPLGPPVLIGGPPALDFLAAALSAIRTSWISDRVRGLVNRVFGEGSRAARWINKVVCFLTGHPVDVATGMVVADAVDFELPGFIPFRFERTYYSRSDYDGPLGRGWGHSYDQFVRAEDDRVVYHDGDGRDVYFPPVAPRGTSHNRVERLTLSDVGGGYVVERADGRRLHFADCGRADGARALASVVDRNDNRLELRYAPGGRLTTIVDTQGRELRLAHDARGRLVRLDAPHPHRPGDRLDVARYHYDGEGDLVAVDDVAGVPLRYAYDRHLLVQETNRRGLSFYFAYDGIDHDAWCVRTWGDGGVFDHALTYDKERRVTVVEDSYGAATTYHCNEAGLAERIVDPLGGETRYEWDPVTLAKLSYTNPAGHTTRFEYDDGGNAVAVTNALGQRATRRVDRYGRVTEWTDKTGRTWRAAFDERGNPVASYDPEGRMTRFWVDRRGSITAFIDPAGAAMQLAYDEAGNLVARTDRSGRVTENTVDAWGRVARVRQPTGAEFGYHHDLNGNLAAVDHPDGHTLAIAYSAGGDPVRVERPDGRVSTHAYDGVGRLVATVNGAGERLAFAYDREGRLTAVVNAEGEESTFAYDAAGHVAREVGFDGAARSFRRDAAGNCTRSTDPAGDVVEHEYDAIGRLTRRTYADGSATGFEYDAAGLVTRLVEGEEELRFERDPAGRVVAEVQRHGTVWNEFDARGSRVRRRTSLGHDVTFERDGDGYVTGLVLPAGRQVRIARGPYEKELAREAGRARLRFAYTPRGRLAAQWDAPDAGGAARPARGFAYDGDGNVVRTDDPEWGTTTYAYDAAGRPTEMRDGAGPVQRVRYRPTGAIASLERRRDGAGPDDLEVRAFEYARGGRLVRAGPTEFAYDAAGRVVERRDADGRRWRYTWDAQSRLAAVTTPGGGVWRYRYDPLGRRIAKVDPRGRVRWTCWDGLTPCHESDGGADVRTFTYEEEFVPLVYETARGVFSVVTDHLRAPRALYDEGGRVAWTARSDIWGRVLGRRARDGTLEDFACRLPGQYEDAETGLHYNWFRYYDPDVGRYLTPDPLGLMGSMLPYQYTTRPTYEIDPLGLAPFNYNGFEDHHTIPRELLDQMRERGLITPESYKALEPADRAGTAGLRRTPHHTAHKELSEFLSERHGLNPPLTDGTQRAKDWTRYLDALEKEDKLTVRKILDDFRRFYHNHLPGREALTPNQVAALQEAFDHDANEVRKGTCK